MRPRPTAATGSAGLGGRASRCLGGFNRFLVEVDRDEPTHRILPLIDAHFARDDHPPFRGLDNLGTRAHPTRFGSPCYVSPHAEDGASLGCRTCKRVGRNPVMLSQPPYGDARAAFCWSNAATRNLACGCSTGQARTRPIRSTRLTQDLIGHPDPTAASAAVVR